MIPTCVPYSGVALPPHDRVAGPSAEVACRTARGGVPRPRVTNVALQPGDAPPSGRPEVCQTNCAKSEHHSSAALPRGHPDVEPRPNAAVNGLQFELCGVVWNPRCCWSKDAATQHDAAQQRRRRDRAGVGGDEHLGARDARRGGVGGDELGGVRLERDVGDRPSPLAMEAAQEVAGQRAHRDRRPRRPRDGDRLGAGRRPRASDTRVRSTSVNRPRVPR